MIRITNALSPSDLAIFIIPSKIGKNKYSIIYPDNKRIVFNEWSVVLKSILDYNNGLNDFRELQNGENIKKF